MSDVCVDVDIFSLISDDTTPPNDQHGKETSVNHEIIGLLASGDQSLLQKESTLIQEAFIRYAYVVNFFSPVEQ